MTFLLSRLIPGFPQPGPLPPRPRKPPAGPVTLACGTCEVQWDGLPGEPCWQCDPPGQGWPAVPEEMP